MTKLEALTDLLEACGADTSRANIEGASFSVWPEADDHFKAVHASGAYVGSLDAAKALHEAVLPGWWYNLAPNYVHVFPAHENGDQDAFTGLSGIPARAWLIAIIKELIAQEDNQ